MNTAHTKHNSRVKCDSQLLGPFRGLRRIARRAYFQRGLDTAHTQCTLLSGNRVSRAWRCRPIWHHATPSALPRTGRVLDVRVLFACTPPRGEAHALLGPVAVMCLACTVPGLRTLLRAASRCWTSSSDHSPFAACIPSLRDCIAKASIYQGIEHAAKS